MANPTSNFGWQMPTPTDLVTDLPADFEVFGQAVDTSLADLKGGTTGQVLSKNSNTDMDFVWVTDAAGDITGVTAGTGISGGGTSGTVTITNSMATEIAAKGDLIVGTGSQTFDNLTAGANDLLLTAASGETTGLKYTGGWTNYTPTLTNITVGNGTLTARHCQIGKTVTVYVAFKMGSTSVMGNYPAFTVPFSLAQNAVNYQFYGEILDAGTQDYVGVIIVGGTTAYIQTLIAFTTYAQPSAVLSNAPMTWTTNDGFQFIFSYEVA